MLLCQGCQCVDLEDVSGVLGRVRAQALWADVKNCPWAETLAGDCLRVNRKNHLSRHIRPLIPATLTDEVRRLFPTRLYQALIMPSSTARLNAWNLFETPSFTYARAR